MSELAAQLAEDAPVAQELLQITPLMMRPSEHFYRGRLLPLRCVGGGEIFLSTLDIAAADGAESSIGVQHG